VKLLQLGTKVDIDLMSKAEETVISLLEDTPL